MRELIFIILPVDLMAIIEYNISAGRNTLYTRVFELTFKRHVMSPTTRPPLDGAVFVIGEDNEYLHLF